MLAVVAAHVEGLVDLFVKVEVLQDIDFTAGRPASLDRQHPDGRPAALHTVEAGAHFHPPVLEGEGVFGIDTGAGDGILSGVLVAHGAVLAVSAPEADAGTIHLQQLFVARLVFLPVREMLGLFVLDAAPFSGVELLAGEVVLKDEYPIIRGKSQGTKSGEEGEKDSGHGGGGNSEGGW